MCLHLGCPNGYKMTYIVKEPFWEHIVIGSYLSIAYFRAQLMASGLGKGPRMFMDGEH